LCNVNGEFDFQTVLHKFQVRRGFVRHKRVTKELAKAQALVDKAVKAAETRWGKSCSGNAQALHAQCQGKEGKGRINNSNTKERAHSLSSSLRFVGQLEKYFQTQTFSDRTAIGNFCRWLNCEIAEGRKDNGIFEQILDIAKNSMTANKPIAAFFSRLDKDIGYRARAAKEKRLAQGA
jgi:hypothetical protein